MKRLLREATAGSADAQLNLGVLYGNGLDDNDHPISSKPREAIRWLLAAAKQGLPQAQMRLAEAYADRPSRSGGLARAYFWFLLAGASLDGIHRERAQSRGNRIVEELTPEEVATAARLAQLWRSKRRPLVPAPTPKPQTPVRPPTQEEQGMNERASPTRYRAVSMELVAYLDGRYVEMQILTDTGKSIAVACGGDSIFAVQRHIEQMKQECPEISSWAPSAAAYGHGHGTIEEGMTHDR